MTLALLVLLLVSGDGHAIVVDRDLCERTALAVRNGEMVTLEDESGHLHQVEMARCVAQDEQRDAPIS